MTDIISKIADDMKSYEELCRYYGEIVRYTKDAYGNNLIDCYGDHADSLKERALKDINEKMPKPF